MRVPVWKAFSNVIIVTGIAVILLVCVIILAQIRDQNKKLQEQQNLIIQQQALVKEQTDINQRFFRCLIQIPPDPNRTAEERLALVDRCTVESKLPPDQVPQSSEQDVEDRARSESPKAQPQ